MRVKAPGLSIVVVNYRTPSDLAEFLASLDAYPPTGAWEAVVVNVGPMGADTEVAERWASGPARSALALAENTGYAVAANWGATQATTFDTLAVFNADVLVRPGCLDALRTALWSRPNWAVLGPRQVDQLGRITAAGIFGTDEAPAHRGWQELDRGQFSDVRDDAIYVAGSAFFIRRALWDALTECPLYQAAAPGAEGALLDTCFLMYEESYLCRHAAGHGGRLVYYGTDDGAMVHKWHRSIKANGLGPAVWANSKAAFRAACDIHGLVHE